jgi:hypothetical protein
VYPQAKLVGLGVTKRELERFGVKADVTSSQMLSVVVCVLLLDRKIVFPKETKESHQHGRPNDDHIWVLPVDGSTPSGASGQVWPE